LPLDTKRGLQAVFFGYVNALFLSKYDVLFLSDIT